MPNQLLYKGLQAPSKASPRRQVKVAPEGVVEAIVAVTGVTDAVDDLIVPGAFAHTLTVRRPKVVDDHEWKNKVGRVLHVEEWMPGDRRLPKKTKDGKPWPAEAGALVATMQYNLNAERGREAYEWVRFYAESNEAEFSIGYKVPDGKARLRRDGVRVILMVDLFEFSHVLFGAAPLSMALQVKAMQSKGNQAARDRRWAPDFEESDTAELEDYDDVDHHPDRPWDDDDKPSKPEKPNAPMQAKTAHDVLLEVKAGGADRNRGDAEQLRHYWLYGEGAAKIGWGTPGDFRRCVANLSEHMSVDQAQGYCQLRHKEATGMYTGDREHRGMSGKAHDEAKAMGRMKGSYEERIATLENAARDLLAGALNIETDDLAVCSVATYGHEAVFRAYGPGVHGDSYLIGYTATDDGVELEAPQKVELSLVAEPDDNEAPDVDDPETVEEITVVQPTMEALNFAEGVMRRLEGKSARRIQDRLAGMLNRMEVKQQPMGTPDDEDPAALDPADDTDSGGSGDPIITTDNLPDDGWNQYKKTAPIMARRMEGPFTVETREGVVASNDGWLAIDSGGFPYPIDAEEFDSVYAASEGPETGIEDEEPADDEALDLADDQDLAPADDQDLETTEDPGATDDTVTVDPADLPALEDAPMSAEAPDEAPDDDEPVTLDPDEHFATLDALDTEDDEEEEDEEEGAVAAL